MIMITGATGNIGRELVRALDLRGMECRALVRDPERALGLPERTRLVRGDFSQPATLVSAFRGVERLFLLTQGIGIEHAAAAASAAQAVGVTQIVFVSSYAVLTQPLPAMARWHHEREKILRAASIPVTLLRPGGFMTNAFDWLPTIRAGGYVIDPVGPGRYAPIDPADIAAVAALALTESDHEDKDYTLTGHERLTVAEQVRIISETIGHPIDVREASTPLEAVQSRFPNGAPPALAEAIAEGFSLMRADTVGFRTDTVARLLGRQPRSFAHFCRAHAEPFRAAYAQFMSKGRGEERTGNAS